MSSTSASPAREAQGDDVSLATLHAERIYRILALVEFDENEGTTFLWSDKTGVEVLFRDISSGPNECPRHDVHDVRPLEPAATALPPELDNVSARKIAQWFIQCDVHAEPAASLGSTQQQDSMSYPETPATSVTPASLHASPSTQQQQQQQQQKPSSSTTHPPSSTNNQQQQQDNNSSSSSNNAELHWIEFSDVHTQVITDAVKRPQGSTHVARATACRFEVPDCFARGFSRLFLAMSATFVRAGTEFTSDLLNAACSPKHVLDVYDWMGQYVDRSRRCFEVRFASFLPRCIETVDAHLQRAIEHKKQMEKREQEDEDEDEKRVQKREEGQEQERVDKPTSTPAAPPGPSQQKLEDIRSLLSIAPRVAAVGPTDSFLIESEIHEAELHNLKMVEANNNRCTTTGGGSSAAAALSTAATDVMLQWCMRRGARGNLTGFDKVAAAYGGFELAGLRRSLIGECSLQNATEAIASKLREQLFGSDDVAVAAAGGGGEGSVGGRGNCVSASLCTSRGRPDEFLVDPGLTQNPQAWPALLWNATDYLKVLKRADATASDNNTLCIPSTHFFA